MGLFNLLGKLRGLLSEIDDHIDPHGKPSSEFLLEIKKTSREAKKRLENEEALKKLEARKEVVNSILPKLKEEIRKQAESGHFDGIRHQLRCENDAEHVSDALVEELEKLGFTAWAAKNSYGYSTWICADWKD